MTPWGAIAAMKAMTETHTKKTSNTSMNQTKGTAMDQ